MKTTLLIGAIGLALGGVVGYHTIYLPKQSQARVVLAKVAQQQADQRAREDVATLLTQIEQYHKRLPPEPEPSWLVREVVTLGRNAGLELTTINPEEPQDIAGSTRLSVNLQFEATYHQLGMFLDAIERSHAFIRVERIDLGTQPSLTQKDTKGPAAVHLVLSTYYFPSALSQAAAAASKHP